MLPHAHALLPNQYEAELLSGVKIRTLEDARRACAVLHARGVHLIVLTSCQFEAPEGLAEGEEAPLSVLLSRRPKVWPLLHACLRFEMAAS